nr:hypothetical protein [uncultured Oribacterium sp.]
MGKNLDTLDDVKKMLSKKSREKIILKKRNQRQRKLHKIQKKRRDFHEQSFFLIPIIVLVLIVLIKILEALGFGAPPFQEKAKPKASTSTIVSSSDLKEDTDQTLAEYNDDVLVKFFQEYFQAKLTADVDTLYRLSGVENQSKEQRERLQKQLKTQAGYIESYDNIKTYAVPGIGKNEKLIFLQYQVHFRRAKTPAPALMYCYMRVNEQNSFELVENKTPEQTKFVHAYIATHANVQDLINAVDSQLLEALSSDSRLAVLYDAFQTGRIYTQDQASIDSEVSLLEVNDDGPAAATESDGSVSQSPGGEASSSASENPASVENAGGETLSDVGTETIATTASEGATESTTAGNG